MSKVEFNNFFCGVDRRILCRVYPSLGLPGPVGMLLVWPCSGSAGVAQGLLLCWDTAGLCPWDHWSSGVGPFSHARAWQGLLCVSGTGTSEGDVGDGADS